MTERSKYYITERFMSNIGRPVKYDKKNFAEKVENYIEMRKNAEKGPMTLLDFCWFADIDRDFVKDHNKGDGSKGDFSATIKKLKNKCERDLEYYLLLGKFSPAAAIFCLKNNYGWKDSMAVTGPNGGPMEMTLVDALKKEIDNKQKEEF